MLPCSRSIAATRSNPLSSDLLTIPPVLDAVLVRPTPSISPAVSLSHCRPSVGLTPPNAAGFYTGPMISSSHPQPTLTAAQMQAQQAAAAQERELAKRRSRKPTDKNIPDGVEDVIVGDGVKRYRELRDVERKLDAAMMRKRLDI